MTEQPTLRSELDLARGAIRTSAEMHVTLEDCMGDDLSIINAARVSYGKRSGYQDTCGVQPWRAPTAVVGECGKCGGDHPKVLKVADAGLINYLMRNRHGTPFEMVTFRFRVSAPIRVLREWQRHRIASVNEISTRYVEMEPRFFVPHYKDVRVQEGKPGHYVMVEAEPLMASNVRTAMRTAYAHAWACYQELVESGVAKEVAAYVLPLGTYSEMIWSVNLRSLFNFCSLRNHEHALREIRYAAKIVEAEARKVCPVAFEAFDKNGRVAP